MAMSAAWPLDAGTADAPRDGLVLEYRFEGDARDSSGNNRHGTLRGSPKFVEGRRGQCLLLDGGQDYVDSSTTLADLGDTFTIECWVNPAKEQNRLSDVFGNHRTGGTGLVIEQSPGQVNRFLAGYGAGGRWVTTSPVRLVPGKWQHIALVKTPGQLSLLVNGLPAASVRDKARLVPSGGNFLVGWSIDDPARRFRGMIDEFRVWKKAVTQFPLDQTPEERIDAFAQAVQIVVRDQADRGTLAVDEAMLPYLPAEIVSIRLAIRAEEAFSGRQETLPEISLTRDRGFQGEGAFSLPPGYYYLHYRPTLAAGAKNVSGPERVLRLGIVAQGARAVAAKEAPATPADARPSVPTTVTRLDGEGWLIATDPKNLGKRENWAATPVKGTKPTRVPSPIQDVFPDYHGVAWYWREFEAPKNPHADGRCLLRFGAVDYLGEVWVNGKPVGSHEGSESPFVLDATEAVNPGGRNLLAVRVLNPTYEPIDGLALKQVASGCKHYPVQMNTVYNSGGVVESVELLSAPAVRLEDLRVLPDWRTGDLRIRAEVRNARKTAATCRLRLIAAPAAGGRPAAMRQVKMEARPGDSAVDVTLHVDQHRLWELNDPYLYRVTAGVWEEGSASFDERSTRCGFRDCRFENGYFRLNGRRIFLFGGIYHPHYPLGYTWPLDPELHRRDVLLLKASGHNLCRIAFGGSIERQLDVFDELGVLVYLEHYASWQLEDSPEMPRRFDCSIGEVMRRARNHPSVIAWGLLNEMPDGPVFRHAAASLPLVRWLDPSRLAMLNSGRFDGASDIGSLSNPGMDRWEPLVEDLHVYRPIPFTPGEIRALRSLGGANAPGVKGRPVFVTEYGQCGAMDLPRDIGRFERLGRPNADDARYYRRQWEQFLADWKALRLDQCWARPEDFPTESSRNLAKLRRIGETALRANPNLVSYSSTHTIAEMGFHGSGITNVFRELKPGLLEAAVDAGAPLRWCLFAEPATIYRGGKVRLEAVLSNLDVLRPGKYPARFQVVGPGEQRVLDRRIEIEIPPVVGGREPPFAQPVFATELAVEDGAGEHHFLSTLERGGAPACGETAFHVIDAAEMPKVDAEVVLWGPDDGLAKWLAAHGIKVRGGQPGGSSRRELLLASAAPPDPGGAPVFADLARRIAQGSVVVFLDPAVFRGQNQPTRWLPLARKGNLANVDECGSFYRGDVWAKAHPIFAGLPAGGILDYHFYREIIPMAARALVGLDPPAEAVCGSTRLSCHYAAGLHVAVYALGEGRFVLNTLRIRENLGKDPVAERLLRSILNDAAQGIEKPIAKLPPDSDRQIRSLGY